LEVAKSVQGIVSKNKSPVKNLEAVNNEITNISENQVKPFLESHPEKIYPKVLEKRLESIEPPTLFKADATLERTFNLTKQRMMEVIRDEAQKSLENGEVFDNVKLWETRIKIDDMMQKEFGNAIFNSEKNSAVKSAYYSMRGEINNFIAERTPGADEGFLSMMKKLSNMYSARQNIAESAHKLLNTNMIMRFIKTHPTLMKGIEISGLGGIGLYGASKVLTGK
jgi:hypothetical protein